MKFQKRREKVAQIIWYLVQLALINLTLSACQGQVSLQSTSATPDSSESSHTQTVPISRTTSPVPNLTPTVLPITTQTISPLSKPFGAKLASIVVVDSEPGYAGRPTLLIVEPDGPPVLVDNFSNITGLSWSPDGQRIAFSAFDSSTFTYNTYLINEDGSAPMRLDIDLAGGAHRINPSWSPDSSQIVFTQTGSDKSYLHIVNIDSFDVHFLAEGASPAWSPIGDTIVFIKPLSDTEPEVGDVYLIGSDGQGMSQLTENIIASHPAWSPDGHLIAFHGYDLEGENDGIYVMNSNGENLTFLTSIGEKPSWISENMGVLVAEEGQLFIISLDGSIQDLLNDDLKDYYFLYAATQPKNP